MAGLELPEAWGSFLASGGRGLSGWLAVGELGAESLLGTEWKESLKSPSSVSGRSGSSPKL